MENERQCSTCHYYDPDEGICVKDSLYRSAYDGQECEDWRDWEDRW